MFCILYVVHEGRETIGYVRTGGIKTAVNVLWHPNQRRQWWARSLHIRKEARSSLWTGRFGWCKCLLNMAVQHSRPLSIRLARLYSRRPFKLDGKAWKIWPKTVWPPSPPLKYIIVLISFYTTGEDASWQLLPEPGSPPNPHCILLLLRRTFSKRDGVVTGHIQKSIK